MTRSEISHLVATDPKYAVAALLALNEFQTIDEQMSHGTVHQNGKGFNGTDAPFMASLIDFYRTRGYLSAGQLFSIRKALPKYFGQLEGIELQPVPFQEMKRTTGTGTASKESTPTPTQSKHAKLDGKSLVITFPYDPLTVAKVKGLVDRKWNADKKYWTAPVCPENLEKLKSWDFEIDPKALEWLNGLKPETPVIISDKPFTVPGLNGTPFPYQLEGIQFIESRKGRALVADAMGLGKTLQALGYLQLHPEIRPAVIVVPASLKLNWGKEINKWMSDKKSYHIISGKYGNGKTPKFPKADIYVINYDILSSSTIDPKTKKKKITCRQDILDLEPKILIMDESHSIKSNDAQRTKACLNLAKQVPHVISLSGTPIVNRPAEMYNSICAVEPKLFPSFFRYAQRYCGAKHNGFGWDFNGASNTKELHQILTENVMIRRLKSEVLKELPDKIRTVIPMELDNQREYDRAEADLIAWLKVNFGQKKADAAKKAEALTRIGELKRLAVRGKLDGCIDWIKEFLDSGQKLVVFAVHKFVIDALMEEFKGIAVKVDGSVSGEQRQAAVDAFQTQDNITLFVGNIQAAGVGLTLTAASTTCFLELHWNPGTHDQAEDRVHRIGQEADSVNAYYLLAAGTMEEEIAELIDHKRQVLSQVLDGKDADEDSMFMELLKKYC